MNEPTVLAVSRSITHSLAKRNEESITLIEGLGVEGDAHKGKKVKHRSRVAKNPNEPNLRQVHLIHNELLDELKDKGFNVSSGEMGENITTSDLDILNLPKETILSIGLSAKIKVTGLRNPCNQLNGIEKGLMSAVLDKDEQGNLIRKAGIMATVLKGGIITPGDKIQIEFPDEPHLKLKPV